jgi:plasmid maintenance system killer protein
MELLESGKSRKYRLPGDVMKKLAMRVQQLEAAHTIHDLWKLPSLNFEHLHGSDTYSVRVTGKWRLEMTISWDDKEHTNGTIFITELSNHYGE